MRKILAFQQKVTDKYCILGKRLKDQRKCHFLMSAEFCQDKIYWKRRGGGEFWIFILQENTETKNALLYKLIASIRHIIQKILRDVVPIIEHQHQQNEILVSLICGLSSTTAFSS